MMLAPKLIQRIELERRLLILDRDARIRDRNTAFRRCLLAAIGLLAGGVPAFDKTAPPGVTTVAGPDAMMPFMRSTVRIDDDLMMELKERARRENVSQTRILNRLLREGIKASRGGHATKVLYKETTIAMGTPRVELDKALELAAVFDDEEILRKMALRK